MPMCSITDEVVMDIVTLRRFASVFERVKQRILAMEQLGNFIAQVKNPTHKLAEFITVTEYHQH